MIKHKKLTNWKDLLLNRKLKVNKILNKFDIQNLLNIIL